MTNVGVRIDRSNPILQNPDVFSRSPLKKRSREEDQVSHPREKQVRENQKEDKELLPNVKRARADLPEEAEANPNFNRNVWTSGKSSEDLRKTRAVEQDPLLHMPKLGGYYVAKIVGSSYELHMTILENQFEVFKVTHRAQERLREEKLDLIKEQIANGKIQAQWSYWDSAFEFFAITGQATVGLGLLAAGNIEGGATMLGGSALSLSGKLLRDNTDYQKTGLALSVAGTLTSLYGGTANMAEIGANDLPEKLSTATGLVSGGTRTYIERRKAESQASQYECRGKDVMNGHKQELNKQEMDKVIGSFAATHPEKTLAAATKVMETEHRIKSDIVAGDKV